MRNESIHSDDHYVRHASAAAVEWTDFLIPGRQKHSRCNLFTAKEISLFQCHSQQLPYSNAILYWIRF